MYVCMGEERAVQLLEGLLNTAWLYPPIGAASKSRYRRPKALQSVGSINNHLAKDLAILSSARSLAMFFCHSTALSSQCTPSCSFHSC